MIQFTQRQLQMLNLLLLSPNGQQVDELSKKIDVSKRTIYREFESLELALQQYNVPISSKNGKYLISGSDTDIAEFSKIVDEQNKTDNLDFLNAKQRQSYIICALLNHDSQEYISFQELSFKLNVSMTTIQNDIYIIDSLVKDYDLTVEVDGQKGKLCGPESAVRNILLEILDAQINEYELFESLRNKEKKVAFSNSIFHLFIEVNKIANLSDIYETLQRLGISEDRIKSDIIFKKVILLVAIIKSRVTHGHEIDDVSKQRGKTGVVENLFTELEIPISNPEVSYLNDQLAKILRDDIDRDTNYDDYNLTVSYMVINFIKSISKQTKWNFSRDNQLNKELEEHITRYIEGNQLLLSSVDGDTLKSVYQRYPWLFSSIEKNIKEYFPNLVFSKQEKILILVYFANSYERKKKSERLETLVIYSGAKAISKILVNHLQVAFPQINISKVIRVSEISEVNLDDFEVILSTTRLPGLSQDYKVINSLLFDEDIKEIESYIGLIKDNQKDNSEMLSQTDKKIRFDEIVELVDSCKQLVANFSLIEIAGNENLKVLLQEIIDELPKKLVMDKEVVLTDLFNKLSKEKVGMPDSNIAFFHGISGGIQKPIVKVFQLNEAIKLTSMKLEENEYKRIFFVIGTENMDATQNELLSQLSSSIIEGNNISTYGYGSESLIEDLIKNVLETQVINNLKR